MQKIFCLVLISFAVSRPFAPPSLRRTVPYPNFPFPRAKAPRCPLRPPTPCLSHGCRGGRPQLLSDSGNSVPAASFRTSPARTPERSWALRFPVPSSASGAPRTLLAVLAWRMRMVTWSWGCGASGVPWGTPIPSTTQVPREGGVMSTARPPNLVGGDMERRQIPKLGKLRHGGRGGSGWGGTFRRLPKRERRGFGGGRKVPPHPDPPLPPCLSFPSLGIPQGWDPLYWGHPLWRGLGGAQRGALPLDTPLRPLWGIWGGNGCSQPPPSIFVPQKAACGTPRGGWPSQEPPAMAAASSGP